MAKKVREEFPQLTVQTYHGCYERVGQLIRVEDDRGLYYFPGDFMVGDPVEVWLDPGEAWDRHLIAQLTGFDRTRG